MNFINELFGKQPAKTGIVFIIEDNVMYAKSIQLFLSSTFPQLKEVKTFPVAEVCLLELNKNPDLIIIDYFLDSRYPDAVTGLEAIEEIREKLPKVNIVVLSSQNEIDVVLDAVKKHNCSYIQKDNQALEKLEAIVKNVI